MEKIKQQLSLWPEVYSATFTIRPPVIQLLLLQTDFHSPKFVFPQWFILYYLYYFVSIM